MEGFRERRDLWFACIRIPDRERSASNLLASSRLSNLNSASPSASRRRSSLILESEKSFLRMPRSIRERSVWSVAECKFISRTQSLKQIK